MGHHSRWLHYTSNELSGFERVRVDVAQTGFFEGREFRAFKELNIPASGTLVLKAVVPINLILNVVSLQLDAGAIRLSTALGGTEGGTFTTLASVFPKNNMSPGPDHRNDFGGTVYARQTLVSEGGTHTGGTELDVTRLKTSANAQQGGSEGVDPDAPRGIAAGTYYFRLLNLSATDAATGTLKVEWEERP